MKVSNDNNLSLGEFVKRRRAELNISTTEAARLSNNEISSSYLNRIENEDPKNLSVGKMKALAKAICVDEWIILNVCGFTAAKSVQQLPDWIIRGICEPFTQLDDIDQKEVSSILEVISHSIQHRLERQHRNGRYAVDSNSK